jgi:hypothetical protein
MIDKKVLLIISIFVDEKSGTVQFQIKIKKIYSIEP